ASFPRSVWERQRRRSAASGSEHGGMEHSPRTSDDCTMFAIHWSSTQGEECLGHGEFDCPQCQGHCRYAHIRSVLRRFCLLVVIPLWRTDTLGEYIRCHGCGLDFGIDVLGGASGQTAAMAANGNAAWNNVRKVVELSDSAVAEIH